MDPCLTCQHVFEVDRFLFRFGVIMYVVSCNGMLQSLHILKLCKLCLCPKRHECHIPQMDCARIGVTGTGGVTVLIRMLSEMGVKNDDRHEVLNRYVLWVGSGGRWSAVECDLVACMKSLGE